MFLGFCVALKNVSGILWCLKNVSGIFLLNRQIQRGNTGVENGIVLVAASQLSSERHISAEGSHGMQTEIALFCPLRASSTSIFSKTKLGFYENLALVS